MRESLYNDRPKIMNSLIMFPTLLLVFTVKLVVLIKPINKMRQLSTQYQSRGYREYCFLETRGRIRRSINEGACMIELLSYY